MYWELTAIFFVLISVCATVFVAPGAMGSGVPETMGILNGVNFDNTIKIDTLIVKCFGAICTVCSGLCLGKEGPFIHIGAILGVCACYLPFPRFELL